MTYPGFGRTESTLLTLTPCGLMGPRNFERGNKPGTLANLQVRAPKEESNRGRFLSDSGFQSAHYLS